jgi:hypothetical protein
MKPKGVLSLDDTLLAHYGKHFDKIAYLYQYFGHFLSERG